MIRGLTPLVALLVATGCAGTGGGSVDRATEPGSTNSSATEAVAEESFGLPPAAAVGEMVSAFESIRTNAGEVVHDTALRDLSTALRRKGFRELEPHEIEERGSGLADLVAKSEGGAVICLAHDERDPPIVVVLRHERLGRSRFQAFAAYLVVREPTVQQQERFQDFVTDLQIWWAKRNPWR